MPLRQSFPDLWLLSDERNDAVLDNALRRLPRGSGFIYRHYHLPDEERIARWFDLLRIAKARGHIAILADSSLTAREWGADGIYGPPRALYPTGGDLLTLGRWAYPAGARWLDAELLKVAGTAAALGIVVDGRVTTTGNAPRPMYGLGKPSRLPASDAMAGLHVSSALIEHVGWWSGSTSDR